MVRVKASEGKGPTTAPSVQHECHFQPAVIVPEAVSQAVTSPGSSACTSAGGVSRPTRPVLVTLIANLFCELGMAVLPGASSEITRYTAKFSSITM